MTHEESDAHGAVVAIEVKSTMIASAKEKSIAVAKYLGWTSQS